MVNKSQTPRATKPNAKLLIIFVEIKATKIAITV
jgi:hypothetical protein